MPEDSAHYWPESSDVISSSSGAPAVSLASPPRGWPDCFQKNTSLRAFMGKRNLQGGRCRLTCAADGTVIASLSAAGVALRPEDPFGNAEAVYEQLGWEIVRGFAIFEAVGGDFEVWTAHKRWWNAKPTGAWVDATPRPSGFASMVLLESALSAAKARRPASEEVRHEAARRLALGGLCVAPAEAESDDDDGPELQEQEQQQEAEDEAEESREAAEEAREAARREGERQAGMMVLPPAASASELAECHRRPLDDGLPPLTKSTELPKPMGLTQPPELPPLPVQLQSPSWTPGALPAARASRNVSDASSTDHRRSTKHRSHAVPSMAFHGLPWPSMAFHGLP